MPKIPTMEDVFVARRHVKFPTDSEEISQTHAEPEGFDENTCADHEMPDHADRAGTHDERLEAPVDEGGMYGGVRVGSAGGHDPTAYQDHDPDECPDPTRVNRGWTQVAGLRNT